MIRSSFLVLMISVSYLVSQAGKGERPAFYSSQFFGLTFGSAVLPVVHLNSGIVYKKYTLGLGIAYDPYLLRKVPLYLDLRYRIVKKRVEPIVFSYIGTSFLRETQGYYYNGIFSNDEIKRLPGFYSEFGLMCKTLVKGNLHYMMSMSYCISQTRFIRYGENYWNGGMHYLSADVLYKLNSNRINFKIGFQF